VLENATLFLESLIGIRPAPRSKEGNEDGIECPFRKKDRSWLTASTFSSRDKGWGVHLSTKAAGEKTSLIPHEGIGISLLPLTALSGGDGLKTLCEGKAVKVVDH
jgi:hypothetical protein